MLKKLVFYLYYSNSKDLHEFYDFHFSCLKEYYHIFDEAVFVISVDDVTDYDLIREAEGKILNIFKGKNVSFDIHKNDRMCEIYAFEKYVVNAKERDRLIFFGHSKGSTNVKQYNKENIYKWIAGMYFFNLNFMDEVERCLLGKKSMSYGSFLMYDELNETNRYKWFYIGTFFWVNLGKIDNYIKQNNIELPSISDRFYAEEFLGDIYPFEQLPYAASHLNRVLINARDFYHYINEYINELYSEEELKEFYSFFEKVKNNG